MSTDLDIRVLGPLEVEREGALLDLGGRKQRSVLAALVLHARDVIAPERLADIVWDGQPPASADSTLRGYIFNLRKALEPDRGADEPRILRTIRAGYVLDVADEQIDSRRFERLIAWGRDRRGDPSGAIDAWSNALALWRGEAFQDFAYSDLARDEVSRLTEMRLSCSEDLFELRLELGRHDGVVGELEAFCAAHPGRERALGSLMLALYRRGRQSDALRAYEDGRRLLAEEFGVDPSPRLRAVHAQILRQEDVVAVETGTADAPPPGRQTLTFLLGDVESSTKKLRALGDDYAPVLEEHRRKLRDVFDSRGGRGVVVGGEEVFAAFDCATDAVAAAVDAQVALAASDDEERRLPVRMGLHTGEATFSGGEFVGLAIHLAARIMAAAHGAQVLVSQATRELFEAEEGGDAAFADVGMHALKDIAEPVRLFQLVHPELRRDFPLLPTRAVFADNLPLRPTSFIGRDRDLDEIEQALGEARVVTLTGVGGVGKTRLALEVGRRLASRYPDGVWFCELAPVVDGEGIVQSVATTLKVERKGRTSLREALLAALRQRSSLVILDNCEHLLEPVAGLVEDIVAECPKTDVLATSREIIGVDGERSRPVRSLGVAAGDEYSDAVRLFTDRARDVRPDFAVDERNEDDVAGICRRLDGIPLAIELAAARVTSLSPAQICRRLEEGFHFLRSGRRAAVDRHRTLHGAIEWSYAMLSEAERRLFDRVSVFAGGFTLEAAEEVCGRNLDIDVADGLASLVAKSVINADVGGEEARYFLLETMRQYAQDRLSEREEAEETLRAHAGYLVRYLEGTDIFSGDSETQFARIQLELDNLRAAHAWAVTAGDVDIALRLSVFSATWGLGVVFQTFFAEWPDAAAALPGAESHRLYPVVLVGRSLAMVQRGELREAKEIAARARSLIDDPDDPRLLRMFTNASFFEGRIEESRDELDEALRLARARRDPWYEFAILYGRSLAEAYAGHHAVAMDLAESAYALARTASTFVQGAALYVLGEALRESGDDERALDCLERSVALSRVNEGRFGAGVALVSVATIRARLGDETGALAAYHEVIDIWRFGGAWVQQWITLRNLAELFGSLREDVPATIIVVASETSRTAVAPFGAQAERLAALKAELERRMGEAAFTAASERGRTMPDEEVVAFATTEIDRVHDERSMAGV